ncbi:BglG family transcription antiterminator [Allobaculum sp. JKK-2023]|uniref:BglG family transcription antiterminator n=1 Tax=Allobaculum sp. JKK-2023 TaxID=3108943 RepID=UPI002B0565E1|nr:PTS sugar transporter subunit IIA [Allobaculum sp. JKK-2023]
MLSQRQIDILQEFYSNQGAFLPASVFCDKLSVSLRTVQSDIKVIKSVLAEDSGARLESKSNKGTCLIVEDPAQFTSFFKGIYQKLGAEQYASPQDRVTQMILLLLNRHRAMTYYELENKFYISHSTLMADLKRAEEILHEYQLELLKSSSRILIDGSELRKRRFLSDQDLYMTIDENSQTLYIDEYNLERIQDLLTEAFVEFRFSISETDLTNLSLLINIAVFRMQNGFRLEEMTSTSATETLQTDDLAKAIMQKIAGAFLVPYSEYEKDFISVCLSSLQNTDDNSVLNQQTMVLVSRGLEEIKKAFDIDFTQNLSLKTTLALHCQSLMMRAHYGLQIQEEPLAFIRESYPLGYELAQYFTYILEQDNPERISSPELSLLALHFYSALLDVHKPEAGKKMLVCTAQRKSITLLIRQTLLRWFSQSISQLDFCQEADVVPEMFDTYDLILTTEKNRLFESGAAMLISPFPEKRDFINIQQNMNGFKSVDDVVNIFRQDLFMTVRDGLKNEILHQMCEQAQKVCEDLDGLEMEIIRRESIGSTYFGHHIALAHPMQAVSADTFISVCICENPVIWDGEGHTVSLVLMMHIGRNNLRAFSLWDYMARIFNDPSFASRLARTPQYSHFISLIRNTLEEQPVRL